MVLEVPTKPGQVPDLKQRDVRETAGIIGNPTIGDFTAANHNHSNVAGGGTIAHGDLTSIGTKSHAQIDNHINGDGSDHADVATNTSDISTNVAAIALNTTHRGLVDEHLDWTASVGTIHADNYTDTNTDTTDHTAFSNIGTNSHAQVDTHMADATKHYIEATIDHTNITNIGTNSHAQIDAHIAGTDQTEIYKFQAGITSAAWTTIHTVTAGKSFYITNIIGYISTAGYFSIAIGAAASEVEIIRTKGIGDEINISLLTPIKITASTRISGTCSAGDTLYITLVGYEK